MARSSSSILITSICGGLATPSAPMDYPQIFDRGMLLYLTLTGSNRKIGYSALAFRTSPPRQATVTLIKLFRDFPKARDALDLPVKKLEGAYKLWMDYTYKVQDKIATPVCRLRDITEGFHV